MDNITHLQCRLNEGRPDEKEDAKLARDTMATLQVDQKTLIRLGIRAVANIPSEELMPKRGGTSRAVKRLEEKIDYLYEMLNRLVSGGVAFATSSNVGSSSNSDTDDYPEGVVEGYETW